MKKKTIKELEDRKRSLLVCTIVSWIACGFFAMFSFFYFAIETLPVMIFTAVATLLLFGMFIETKLCIEIRKNPGVVV